MNPGAPLLGAGAVQAIKALLELAQEPAAWRSVRDLAAAQQLPPARLEQLLLRLRRAGLLQAQRGRLGGYRLALAPAAIPLQQVLQALAGHDGEPQQRHQNTPPSPAQPSATSQVTQALERRLQQAIERELSRLTLEELLYDLQSARAAGSPEGGLVLG